MGKGYKGKTCAYCGSAEASDSADHVLARQLVAERFRQQIPMVPACKACNGKKSVLEHYAATILPFGGRDANSAERFRNDVGRRLARNQKLDRTIAAGRRTIWLTEKGILRRETVLPIDRDQINALVGYIVRGLMFHHWQVTLDITCFADVENITVDNEKLVHDFFQLKSLQRIEGNIGEGALTYRASQGIDDPRNTVWEVNLYGGLAMRSNERFSLMTRFAVMTGIERRIAATSADNG